MVSDAYFVLEQIKEGTEIVDFRDHQYGSIRALKPGDVSGPKAIDARSFLRALGDADPNVLTAQSRQQLVGRLESMAENYDTSAECGFGTRDEVSLYCGVRDNITQLLEILKK